MKKTKVERERLINLVVGLLAAGIMVVVLFKFVINRNPRPPFGINDFEKILVTDLSGSEVKLSDLVSPDVTGYCLIFEIKDCPPCIYEGLQDLKKLKEAGKPCLALVVHDLINEVSGWAAVNDFSPIFMLRKVDFYEHFHSVLTPVVVKLKNGKVVSHRYITP